MKKPKQNNASNQLGKINNEQLQGVLKVSHKVLKELKALPSFPKQHGTPRRPFWHLRDIFEWMTNPVGASEKLAAALKKTSDQYNAAPKPYVHNKAAQKATIQAKKKEEAEVINHTGPAIDKEIDSALKLRVLTTRSRVLINNIKQFCEKLHAAATSDISNNGFVFKAGLFAADLNREAHFMEGALNAYHQE